MLYDFKLPHFLANVKAFATNLAVFRVEVKGREWKEPDRATGVPAPPPRSQKQQHWLKMTLTFTKI